jgi:hypothetical protein
MYAERLILETDLAGKLKQMPTLPPNKQFEAIFLVIEDSKTSANVRRRPHPEIAGKLEIIGNVFDSASVSAWNLPE